MNPKTFNFFNLFILIISLPAFAQEAPVIGEYTDIVSLNDQLIVLDRLEPKIIAFKKNDEIELIGRKGRGPGEFMKPVSIEVFKTELHVLDNEQLRINIFSPSPSKQEWSHKRDMKIDFFATDFCSNDKALFIYGLKNNKSVHTLDDKFEVISSFALDDDTSLQSLTIKKEGLLECDDQRLYVAPVNQNNLQIIDLENKKKWEISFSEVAPLQFVTLENDGMQRITTKYYSGEAYDKRGGFHDRLFNIQKLNEDHILLQYKRYFKDSDSSDDNIISIHVNLHQKEYIYHNNLPIIFKDSDDKFIGVTGAEPALTKINREVLNFDDP